MRFCALILIGNLARGPSPSSRQIHHPGPKKKERGRSPALFWRCACVSLGVKGCGYQLVGKHDGEIFADQIDRVAAKARTLQGCHGLSMDAFIGEIRASRDAHFGILDAEARLPDHRSGELFTRHDTLIDVLVKWMGVSLGSQFISESFT